MIFMKTKNKLSLSLLDQHILMCLGGNTMYGLELLQALNKGRPIPLDFGSIYPALDRGVAKGLLKWRWGDDGGGSGGGRRKYFTATVLGVEALELWDKYQDSIKQNALAPDKP
jgi:PadR family transcriptional regulator, regulatory protein PadR